MSTYVIGDIQGCFAALEALLTQIDFDSAQDILWFTGDLVNRGPDSLAVLRFVKSLGQAHQIVLGNHDLHLLAVAYGMVKSHSQDTLEGILEAPDKEELLHWLRHQPLLVHDPKKNYVMTHAGLAPCWTVDKAIKLAKEVEAILQGDQYKQFLAEMYGNQPDQWDDALTGMDRLRCITNYLTRMRFCHLDGRIDLIYKGNQLNQPPDLVPWFQVKSRVNKDANIVFGHWAALNGVTYTPQVFALDTGCVWGNCLTAMRLEDQLRFHVRC